VLTPVNEKPWTHRVPAPFQKDGEYDLPVWIHPRRGMDYPDYRTEEKSKYRVFSVFGWPYETTVAMTRIVSAAYSKPIPP